MAFEQTEPNIIKIPDPVQFFDTFYYFFHKAARQAGETIDRYFLIHGQTICLRFAGPALVSQLTPALAHLAIAPVQNPALIICIWDSASTLTSKPPLPPSVPMPRGDIPGYMNQRIVTHVGADLFSTLDRERGLAVYWCADAQQLPLYERGAPLRSILHWWFQTIDIHLVHAGAIGNQNGAVLLAGKGGSGKSTTCLSCLQSDLLYISDDYSFIGLQPQPYVHTIYNTAKLRPDNLQRLPHLRQNIANADKLKSEKALFFLQQHFPDKLARQLPLKALLLPGVSGEKDTRVKPAAARESLGALLLSTMHQLAGTDQKTISTIKELVTRIPSYHLRLGSDLSQIPTVISDMLP